MYQIDNRVRAKIDLIDDLSDHGMGQQCYARRGETLVVRRLSPSGQNLYVSHEHILDRDFRVTVDEVELVT